MDAHNGQIIYFQHQLHAIQNMFAPSQFDDPKGALFKHSQTTSINEYQNQFEPLSNRVIGLRTQFLLSCFISSLKPHTHWKVQALQPMTLIHPSDLAKIQEQKHNEMRITQRIHHHCCHMDNHPLRQPLHYQPTNQHFYPNKTITTYYAS